MRGGGYGIGREVVEFFAFFAFFARFEVLGGLISISAAACLLALVLGVALVYFGRKSVEHILTLWSSGM